MLPLVYEVAVDLMASSSTLQPRSRARTWYHVSCARCLSRERVVRVSARLGHGLGLPSGQRVEHEFAQARVSRANVSSFDWGGNSEPRAWQSRTVLCVPLTLVLPRETEVT